jgi:hypothetical protein
MQDTCIHPAARRSQPLEFAHVFLIEWLGQQAVGFKNVLEPQVIIHVKEVSDIL